MPNSKNILVILLVLLSGFAMAQTGTNSPYSLSAIGELKFAGFTQHTAAGGTSVSVKDRNNFTPVNPASYANLDFTVFDVGLGVSLRKLSSSSASTQSATGNFDHFAMAFPFETERKMAVSFGTYQFSDVGYDIENRINTDTPSYYTLFRGTGGLNKVYLGYGVEVVEGLNLGANVNYYFGSIQALNAKVYPTTDDLFSFSDETFFAYSGFDFDLGVQYSIQTKGLTHTIGAAYHTGTDLKGDGYRYAETFFGRKFDQGTLTPIDTLLFDDNLSKTSVKPGGFSIGYTLSSKDKWSISLEMEQNNWSSVTNELNGLSFFDNMKYAGGINIIPMPKYEDAGNYLKKIRYSAGFRYEQLYYNFFDEQISEVGISFGLGLPIVRQYRDEEGKKNIISRVNLTAEYTKRGTTDNGLIQEDYINIGIGLNFNDKWFTKRKYQ